MKKEHGIKECNIMTNLLSSRKGEDPGVLAMVVTLILLILGVILIIILYKHWTPSPEGVGSKLASIFQR